MNIREAHRDAEGRVQRNDEDVSTLRGESVGVVNLSPEEVYEAVARAALVKHFGEERARTLDGSGYSVRVLPEELGNFVMLGGAVRADIRDGYAEVLLWLLPPSARARLPGRP